MLTSKLHDWPMACDKFGFQGNVRFDIPEVRCLWNPQQYQEFDKIDDGCEPLLVFHATNWENLHLIVENNFDPQRSVDGWFGNGAYFTTNMVYSQHYIRLKEHNSFRGKSSSHALQLPKVGNVVQVIGVLIKPGKTMEVTSRDEYRNRPAESGYQSHHAWVNPEKQWSCGFLPVPSKERAAADEYVMFDKMRILPRFLISLRRLEDGPKGESDYNCQHKFLNFAKEYNWKEVERMIEADPGIINCQPAGRWGALHQAVEYGHDHHIIKFLLAHEADPELKNRDAKTPLELNDTPQIHALLRGEGKLDTDSLDPDVPMQHAFLDLAKNFQWAEVKRSLAECPKLINASPSRRWTALHQAAHIGDKEMVQYLIRMKASVNIRNSSE